MLSEVKRPLGYPTKTFYVMTMLLQFIAILSFETVLLSKVVILASKAFHSVWKLP